MRIPKAPIDASSDGIIPSPYVWNNLRDEISAIKKLAKKNRLSFKSISSLVLIYNNTGSPLDPHTVISLGDTAPLPSENANEFANKTVFTAVASQENDIRYAITLEGIPNETVGKAFISGAGTAEVEVLDLNHEYVKINSLGTLETTDTPSQMQLLYAENVGPGELCKVRMASAGGYQQHLKVTPDADLMPGTTGNCTIVGGLRDGETLPVLFDWIDDEKISAGKEVIVARFRDEETTSEIWRPVAAQCEDPPPPNQAIAGSANQVDSVTGVWGDLPGFASESEFGSGYTYPAGRSGFEITSPGYWTMQFSFSAEVSANNTTISIRGVNDSGTGTPIDWIGRTAGDSVGATFSFSGDVTQAELDAGTVYFLIERNISNDVTWQRAEIILTRQGYGEP